ncbi:MAG: 30S ribosome-binding factor RbfA [Pseudohongiella sp.]|nr:30S ribosome-binding factor RbfA [Pseudohongiella sp.]
MSKSSAPKVSPRVQRVADQIQRLLADLIRREIRDPRVGMVSVTGVDVSRDFAHANVHVTIMGRHGDDFGAGQALKDMGELDRKEIKDSLAALNKAAGYLRSLLGKEMSLRVIPALQFHYDDSVARGRYLSSLIDKAIAEDSTHEHVDETDSDQSPEQSRDGDN